MRLVGYGHGHRRDSDAHSIPSSDNAHMHPIYANTGEFYDSEGNMRSQPRNFYRHDNDDEGDSYDEDDDEYGSYDDDDDGYGGEGAENRRLSAPPPPSAPVPPDPDRLSFANSFRANVSGIQSMAFDSKVPLSILMSTSPDIRLIASSLARLQVIDLKAILKQLRLRFSGNKMDLVNRAAEELSLIYHRGNREEVNETVRKINEYVWDRNPSSSFANLPLVPDASAQQQALAACAHLKLTPPIAEPWVVLKVLSQPILVDELLRDPANLLPLYLRIKSPSTLAQSKQIEPRSLRCIVVFFRVKSGSDRVRLEEAMGARRRGNLQVPIPGDLSFRRTSTYFRLFSGNMNSTADYIYHIWHDPHGIDQPYEIGVHGMPRIVPYLDFSRFGHLALVPESFPASLKSGYAFQVFEIYEDRAQWAKASLAKMPVRPADKVVEGLLEKAKMDEIAALKLTISLRCPLSMTRLVKPVRSHACRHAQCFDLETAQQLQSHGNNNNGTISRCPICQMSLPSNSLFIDGLVQEVVAAVPSSVDEVILDLETGKWSIPTNSEAQVIDAKPSRKRLSTVPSPPKSTPMKRSRQAFPSDPSQIIDLTGIDESDTGNPLWDAPVPIKRENAPSVVVLSNDDDDDYKGSRQPGASVFAAIIID